MAQRSFQLVMRSGPHPGKIFELEPREMTIGRDVSNDITINDAEVSRRHARLIPEAGGFVLEDTGSTNGTFINGNRLTGPHLLRPGELILFGENVSLAYEPIAFDPDATLATSSNLGLPSQDLTPGPAEIFSLPEHEEFPPARQEPPVMPPRQELPYVPPQPQYAPPQQPQYAPPQQPQYQQQQYQQPQYTPPPAYAQPAPPPVGVYPDAGPKPGANRNRLLITCGCIIPAIACLALVAFLFWVDQGGADRWCQFFGFLTGCP